MSMSAALHRSFDICPRASQFVRRAGRVFDFLENCLFDTSTGSPPPMRRGSDWRPACFVNALLWWSLRTTSTHTRAALPCSNTTDCRGHTRMTRAKRELLPSTESCSSFDLRGAPFYDVKNQNHQKKKRFQTKVWAPAPYFTDLHSYYILDSLLDSLWSGTQYTGGYLPW